MLLPSLEEGSALVCGEAMGVGCALLVSDASSGICRNNENALIHAAGDVETLARHISLLNDDRAELARLRSRGARHSPRGHVGQGGRRARRRLPARRRRLRGKARVRAGRQSEGGALRLATDRVGRLVWPQRGTWIRGDHPGLVETSAAACDTVHTKLRQHRRRHAMGQRVESEASHG